MASGAVGPPEGGDVAGVLVTGADVGTATATGVGAVFAACCARMVASTAAESASAPESLDFVSVVCVESDVVVEDNGPVLPDAEPLLLAVVLELALLASDG